MHDDANTFYGNCLPDELIDRYGSPLYVYNEQILRERCREMTALVSGLPARVNYSAKANTNLKLLQIVRSEGLDVDAMSPGEIFLFLRAGFHPDQILYIGNNVSSSELQFAIDHHVKVSVDSVSQLERFGRLHPGSEVAVRFNPGVGAGHHEKVVTGGAKTKFGVMADDIGAVKEVLQKYHLQLTGINQHIGSLFLDDHAYLEGVRRLLEIAGAFPEIHWIDFGGGFGIPYQKDANQSRLNLSQLGTRLRDILSNWLHETGRSVEFKIEPGRYIVAECGRLLGTVYALKENYGVKYVGTDLGFNVLMRPVLYGSHHDLHLLRNGQRVTEGSRSPVTVVGNICETGDKIAEGYDLPAVLEGDLIEVMDAGAYGYVMSSNYNCRLRPAEVLIDADGNDHLIRRRDKLEDLLSGYPFLIS